MFRSGPHVPHWPPLAVSMSRRGWRFVSVLPSAMGGQELLLPKRILSGTSNAAIANRDLAFTEGFTAWTEI